MSSNVYHNSFFAMGTRMNVIFPFHDEEICERIFNLIRIEVNRIENKLSFFIPGSDVSFVNKFAFRRPVELDEEMYELIKLCAEYKALTSGSFNICMRGIMEILNNGNHNLSPDEITDLSFYELNGNSIRFLHEKTKIDFGAVGKGYALDKIKYYLDNSPIENFFISFGESSILTKGKHPLGDAWKIGINDLFNSGESIYTFYINKSSISTSGNCFVDDSGQINKKNNVVDPSTGLFYEPLSSMSVCSEFPVQAEILSTAFLVMQDEKIRKTVDKLNGVKAVRINYGNETKITEYNPDGKTASSMDELEMLY